MHNSQRTIVLIDDEPGPMKYYIKALEKRGFHVIVLPDADKAYEFFGEAHPEVQAIILDIMMSPGKYFEDEDHDQGLKTGLFIYRRILEQKASFAGSNSPLPVAVLTNVSNPDTLTLLDVLRLDKAPKEQFRVWPKVDVAPMAFAEQLERWLGEVLGMGEMPRECAGPLPDQCPPGRQVVLVNDRIGAMEYWIGALQGSGFGVMRISDADVAWEFFDRPHPAVCAVLLDVIMPPGNHMAPQGHDRGQRTGLFLLKRIVEQERRLAYRQTPLLIAMLTSTEDEEVITLLENESRSRPSGYTAVRIWKKLNVPIKEVPERIERFLQGLDI